MNSSGKDDAMDTSDQPGGDIPEPPRPTTDLQNKEIRKYLMECPNCAVKFSPSVSFVMEKNDPCKFSIDLHNENGDKHICLTNKIPFKEMSTDIVDQEYCKHCKYSVATTVNHSGGFDLELSIKIPKENQLEDSPMDAQPATQDISAGSSTGEPSVWQKITAKFQTRTPVKVKVHCIATGETFGAIDSIKNQLKINSEPSSQIRETKTREECNIIIFFRPVSHCVELEVKSAMKETAVSSSGKPIILVLMHHTRDADHPTLGYEASEVWKSFMLHVHVFYHETIPGLLKCKQNDEAIKSIKEKLQTYKQ